jgi:penicillin-binding protein 1A
MNNKILSILKFILFCIIFVTPFFAYFLYKISEDLPDYQILLNYNPDKATYIYDRNNDIIGEIANQKRIFVSIDEIPTKLKNAFIAAEDKTFYENSGIDPAGFIKAMIRNIIITIREPGTSCKKYFIIK